MPPGLRADCGAPPAAFVVVGMAAFFAAVVRAPITGIVLVTELTAGFTLLIPMLWASLAAMAIPTLFESLPIYDSLSQPKYLRERGGENRPRPRPRDDGGES